MLWKLTVRIHIGERIVQKHWRCTTPPLPPQQQYGWVKSNNSLVFAFPPSCFLILSWNTKHRKGGGGLWKVNTRAPSAVVSSYLKKQHLVTHVLNDRIVSRTDNSGDGIAFAIRHVCADQRHHRRLHDDPNTADVLVAAATPTQFFKNAFTKILVFFFF